MPSKKVDFILKDSNFSQKMKNKTAKLLRISWAKIQKVFTIKSIKTVFNKSKARELLKAAVNFWQCCRQNRRRTIILILAMGVSMYILLVTFFAIIYYYTKSIGSVDKGYEKSFFNAFYFSFVSFITIGYGDIAPTSNIGKLFLFLESIFSILFNGTFPSLLIYYAQKRPNTLFATDKIILYKELGETFHLQVMIANKGEDLVDCKATFKVFGFTSNHNRYSYFLKKFIYSIIEHENTARFSINLQLEKNIKLLTKLQEILSNPAENCMLMFSITGSDADSGELVTLIRYFTEQDIVAGFTFKNAINWTDSNERSTQWSNFNELEIDPTFDKQTFIEFSVPPPQSSIN
jgi:hypothetical protein